MTTNWSDYYKVCDLEPRETTKRAVEIFNEEKGHISGLAIDLGCGNGRDTLAMLNAGFSVYAIDCTDEAIQLMKSHPLPPKLTLETRVAKFEDIDTLPENLLVNASFSLPFCHPDNFSKLWNVIKSSIMPGGRFAGHFFGEKDDWSKHSDMSSVNNNSLNELFTGFQIEELQEREWDGESATGPVKHWHVFSVVAKKL
jgi:SAM-dependent methyltransferase